jgi:sigma-B regulation protein RsbU (phosphoserine phosphatase)
MSGMPIEPIGWVLLHAIDKSILTEPTVMTQDQIDLLMSAAVSSVNNEILRAIILIAVLLAVVVILVLFFAGKLSGRIVDPLENMTNRIVSIKGEDLLFPMEDTYRTGDEIEVLAGSFSDLSSRTLQYVDQVKTVTAEKERIGAELSMATAIQASQLPRLFPAFPEREEFKLHASMTPAKEVGGDFYDFYFVDQDHIALIVADVSGKGVPAALFMMISRVLIKSRLQNGESPGEALMHANDQLCENNEAGLFVTVWAAVIQISTGKGVAINAGHEHPALRKGNGPFELVEYEHSLAVAAFEGVPFEEHEFQMNPGDCLFVYTDGVPESQNPQGELFEMERMIEALNVDPTAEPEQLIENVKKGIEKFVDGAEQFDDTTMLCFRYDGVK